MLVKVDYDVKMSGPLFDGNVSRAMKRVVKAIEDEIGDRVVDEVQATDSSTFKNPTGHATSMVKRNRVQGEMRVNRSNIPYGPWLEDGGSRSEIFEGYNAFAKAVKVVDREVPEIVDRHLVPVVRG